MSSQKIRNQTRLLHFKPYCNLGLKLMSIYFSFIYLNYLNNSNYLKTMIIMIFHFYHKLLLLSNSIYHHIVPLKYYNLISCNYPSTIAKHTQICLNLILIFYSTVLYLVVYCDFYVLGFVVLFYLFYLLCNCHLLL